MGIVNIKGLGPVEIEGSVPTKEESARILRAMKSSGATKRPPPISEPLLSSPAPDEGDGEDRSGLGNAFIQGLSRAARGFAVETPRALDEALPGIGYILPQTSLQKIAEWATGTTAYKDLHESWKEWEDRSWTPEVGDIREVFEDPSWSETPEKLAKFVAETGVNAIPGMALAGLSLPASAYSMIGDIARTRAANRGSDTVSPADVGVAAIASTGISALERVGAKGIVSPVTQRSALGRIGRAAAKEASTEAVQESIQTVAEQIGTRDEGVLGVDIEEMGWRALGGGIAGGALGGAGRGVVDLVRPREGDRPRATRYVEEMTGGVVSDLDESLPARSVESEIAAEEVIAADEPLRARIVRPDEPRRPGVTAEAPPAPEPVVSEQVEQAELVKSLADPSVPTGKVEEAIMVSLAGRHLNAGNIDRSGLAAKFEDIDPVMLQAAEDLLWTDEQKKGLTKSKRVAVHEIMAEARSQGLMPTPKDVGLVDLGAKLDELIRRVNSGEHSPSVVEQAAIHAAVMSGRKARNDIIAAMSVPDADAELYRTRLAKADQDILDAGLALRRAGSEFGRGLAYRQFIVKEIPDLASAKVEFILKKGRQLTPKENEEIARLWKSAEKDLESAQRDRRGAKHDLLKAKRLLKRAEKSGSVRGVRAAEKATAKAYADMAKADGDIRRAQRSKSQVPVSVLWTDKAVAAYRKVFGASIILSSSGDDSALGRQAIHLALQNPVLAAKTLPVSYQLAPWTKDNRAYAARVQDALLGSPMQMIRDLAGLELTEVEGRTNVLGGPIEAREEMFMFRALESGLVGDWLVHPSQNAFALTLNLLRAANFDQGVRDILAPIHGVKDPKNIEELRKKIPREDIEALALIINASTGRGDWVAGTGAFAQLARHVMFAPRFTISRIETPYRVMQLVLGMGKFANVSDKARTAYAKRIGRNVGFLVGLGLLSGVLGPDDPWENIANFARPGPDHLKLVVGDYHVDMTGGLSSTWRYVIPLITSPDEFGRGMTRMARNKIAPLLGAFWQAWQGKDFRGRDVAKEARKTDKLMEGVTEELFNKKLNNTLAVILHRAVFPAMGAFTPITIQNVAESAWEQMTGDEKELVQRLIPIALDAFGVGTAHYEAKPSRRR